MTQPLATLFEGITAFKAHASRTANPKTTMSPKRKSRDRKRLAAQRIGNCVRSASSAAESQILAIHAFVVNQKSPAFYGSAISLKDKGIVTPELHPCGCSQREKQKYIDRLIWLKG